LKNRSYLHLLINSFLIGFILLSNGCTVTYKMNAASTEGLKSVSVAYFPNRADIVNPTLSQEFTEMLKDKFISQTRLEMVPSNGDIRFEGEIIGYSTDPAAITRNETAALNRFTIQIKVKFVNINDPSKDFESTFRHFSEYDSQQSLDAVESQLIPEILEKIVEDIFNRALVNW